MNTNGSMAELVDATDLKSVDENRAGSTPATPTRDNEVYAGVSVFQDAAIQMGERDLRKYVYENIARGLIGRLVNDGYLVLTRRDNMFNYSIDFSTRVFVFSAEQLEKHDKDVIEEFCSREK